MLKPDERQMMAAALARRSVFESLPANPKRAEYILDKWCCRGWWEYGTSPLFGWLTPEGVEGVRSALARDDMSAAGRAL